MYARKVGAAWEVFAPAKLNLYLDVLGRRSDGFHELETLMAPIRLYDVLQWHARRPDNAAQPPGLSLRYDSTTAAMLRAAAPADERNLVWRAAVLLAKRAGIEPHGAITLTKRIPVQAGLGGGSSDAAAALVLLNAAWGLDYPRAELSPLAAELGSDVPFFLAGRSAVCRGRGEIVAPLPALPRLDVVVAVPRAGVSTSAAFQLLDQPPTGDRRPPEPSRRLAHLVEKLQSGSVAAAGRWMANALQPAASRLLPEIDRLGTHFARGSCCAHLLTGSGSAYFGVMRSARQARRLAAQLASTNVGTVFSSATCC